MATIDLNRVAIFARVVEARGFTAAARALGLPKSSVSRAVALLEEELGTQLLRRSTRALTLTEAGSAFYERAARGLEAMTEARDAVVALEEHVRGPIRITAPVDAGAWLLGPLIATFLERHPEVRIEVVLTGRIVDLVQEGIDLALRAGPLRDPELIARRLAPLALGLYASPAYLDARGAPESVAALAEHRCVVFRGQRGGAVWTLEGPAGAESVEVEGALRADDFAFLAAAVIAGAGIGLLPELVAAESGGRLVRVLPDRSVAGGGLHLVYPPAPFLPRRVALFRDFLVEALGPRPPG
jgi:DNA-binding transcriptional LysR family regulator